MTKIKIISFVVLLFGMNVISFLVVCVPTVHLKDNLIPTGETHTF